MDSEPSSVDSDSEVVLAPAFLDVVQKAHIWRTVAASPFLAQFPNDEEMGFYVAKVYQDLVKNSLDMFIDPSTLKELQDYILRVAHAWQASCE